MNLIRQGIEDLPCKGKGSVEKPGREEEFNCAVGAKLSPLSLDKICEIL